MDFEPGPFAEREPLPLGPRIATDGRFEHRAELLIGGLVDTDGPLHSISLRVGDGVPSDLGNYYAGTVGAAEDVTANQDGAGYDLTADNLSQTGEGAEAYRQSVLRYLPQPDMDIPYDFSDPPPPPGAVDNPDDGSSGRD